MYVLIVDKNNLGQISEFAWRLQYTEKMKTENILVGETTVTLQHYLTDQACTTKLIRVHGDELSARDCSLRWLQEQGGEYIDIDNPSREIRFQYQQAWHSVDPNRMFSSEGISASIRELGSEPTQALIQAVQPIAEKISQLLLPATTVVALHNNLDFNINYYLPGGECVGSGRQVHQSNKWHPHDFVLVSDASDFDNLANLDVNVVLLNDEVTDHSGSLSEHCMARKQRYFNIETYRGHVNEQFQLLRWVMEIN